MRKISNLLFAAAAALSAWSCSIDQPVRPQFEGDTMEFIAELDGTPSSKTTLVQGHQVQWTSTDQISVSNGQQSASFQLSQLSEDGRTAHFTGQLPAADRYRAIYPHQDGLLWANAEVTAELPTVQQAMAGTFADGTSLAVAEVEGQSLHFKNVGALLSVTISNDHISAVRISSADGTAMTGPAEITVAASPSVKAGTAAQSYVELKGNFVKGETYYAVVYPGNQANGFELTFTDDRNRTATFRNTQAIDIRRNANIALVKNLVIPPEKWITPEPVYRLVKNVDELKAGDVIRIGVPTKNVAAGPLSSSQLSAVPATFDADKMKSENAIDFTLDGTPGAWILTSSAGNLVASAGETALSFDASSQVTWNISKDTEGRTMVSVGTKRSIMLSGDTKFKHYAKSNIGNATYTTVQLYKLGEGSSPDPNPDPDPDPTPDPQPDPTPGQPANGQTLWMEMPGISSQDGKVGTYYAGNDRNYTYNYQYSTYTSLWVAYPLYSSTTGGKRNGSWKVAPGIPESEQINIWDGSYGVDIGASYYARGHQIPDADRSGRSDMQSQTYHAINSTPQIQDGFNGGIWMHLESGVRDALVGTDTIYVVTGATFQKVGGNETIKKIKPRHDTKMCPVPNYYWKVLLKVKKSGKAYTDAKAIGFWLPHQVISGEYATYATSVDEIEKFTGFDFFVNLPVELQKKAEAEKNWTGFSTF